MDPRVLEKINKIKALAERGSDGEKVNAEELLSELLKKYDIREEDLLEDRVYTHTFKYWGHLGKKLFYQVAGSVLGQKNFNMKKYTHKRNCNIRFIDCTDAQAIEINETFRFYRYHLDRGFKNYLDAFIQRENIFPRDAEAKEMTLEEYEEYINSEAYRLQRVIKKHERYLMIEGAEDE